MTKAQQALQRLREGNQRLASEATGTRSAAPFRAR